LAVSPSTQGHGLGKKLVADLFAKVKAETAILLTHQQSTRASQMYLREGWIELKNAYEVSPGKFFSILGKTLRAQGRAKADMARKSGE
jgi:hypothetical protein